MREHDIGFQMRLAALTAILAGKVTSDRIAAACVSQSALAKLNLPEKNINPMSLNTLKSAAQRSSQSGWENLDDLRKKVLLKNSERKNSISKANRASVVKHSLQNEIDESFRVRSFLYRAYSDLLALAEAHSRTDSSFQEKLLQHKELFLIEIGFHIVRSDNEK
ncbi:hypothetical protein [Duganella sacchari]|uniref:hypothetical protein n=1 Tax=Duganella sacchari TaxID=551987 RepID=UPI001114F686|nr:hypothetical protein [Duganella sacchari]